MGSGLALDCRLGGRIRPVDLGHEVGLTHFSLRLSAASNVLIRLITNAIVNYGSRHRVCLLVFFLVQIVNKNHSIRETPVPEVSPDAR